MNVGVRPARREDAAQIARIYNQGIEDRVATFETRFRTAHDIERWFDAGFPVVVAGENEGPITGWAAAPPYRPERDAYRGVAEFSVYVDRASRGQGVGRVLMQELMAESARRGLWKLVSRIFRENEASLALCRAAGFREVGVYKRHARLDGAWKDCVIVERLLGDGEVEPPG